MALLLTSQRVGPSSSWGAVLLIAPNPSPEEVAPYVVALPPGTWYDYWTGEQYMREVPGASLDAEQRDLVIAEKELKVTPSWIRCRSMCVAAASFPSPRSPKARRKLPVVR